LGNGEMLVWVDPGDVDTVPQDVFALINGAHDHLQRWDPRGGTDVPQGPTDLMTRLSEVTEETAAEVLVWLLSATMAYKGGGRYEEAKARDTVKTLRRLLGYGAHWWTNVDSWNYTAARSWNPVTRHTMDTVVIGAGGGVIVTVLAVDED
jgi:hypothetical protein